MSSSKNVKFNNSYPDNYSGEPENYDYGNYGDGDYEEDYDDGYAIQRYAAENDSSERFRLGPGDTQGIRFHYSQELDIGPSTDNGESSQKVKKDKHRSKDEAGKSSKHVSRNGDKSGESSREEKKKKKKEKERMEKEKEKERGEKERRQMERESQGKGRRHRDDNGDGRREDKGKGKAVDYD